jgi:hypothetical protein
MPVEVYTGWSLNPNRSDLLKAHLIGSCGSDRQAVGSVPRTCRIRTIFMVRSAARPSDCRQVACIQGKDPRALQSRRGVHLATGSKGSKLTTWCPSNEPIQQFSSCDLACVRQLLLAVVISPCGSCYGIWCNFMLSMYELWRPSI